jgi:hypothetical protein
MTQLAMRELTGAELDAVCGGQAVAAGGLVNVALNAEDIEILTDFEIPVDVTVRNVANNNNVSVGAIIQALGGGAAILQRQTQG